MSEESINVRVEFKDEMALKFEAVKKHLGLQNSTDVLRLLVNDKYNELSQANQET